MCKLLARDIELDVKVAKDKSRAGVINILEGACAKTSSRHLQPSRIENICDDLIEEYESDIADVIMKRLKSGDPAFTSEAEDELAEEEPKFDSSFQDLVCGSIADICPLPKQDL